MGISLSNLNYFLESKTSARSTSNSIQITTCLTLAERVLIPLFDAERRAGRQPRFSNFFIATSCPDRIAPSLGQTIQSRFPEILADTPTFDIVQGCSGSVTTLALAAKSTEYTRSNSLFLCVDAAAQAVKRDSPLFSGFSDGAFACVLEYRIGNQGLMTSLTKQYSGITEVVSVGLGLESRHAVRSHLGHDADPRFKLGFDLENQLGLRFNPRLGVKLMRNARKFAAELLTDQPTPDYIILHQANYKILQAVQKDAFPNQKGFLFISKDGGNCGTATIGVVLSENWNRVKGKKVLLCSFGTGGVISGSLWHF